MLAFVPHPGRVVLAGVAMVVGSLTLDLLGSDYGMLPVLILSFALGIAGALVAFRGLVEFIAGRL